jgi:hypothetical protein
MATQKALGYPYKQFGYFALAFKPGAVGPRFINSTGGASF